jgi:hypothetical protein
MDRADQHVRGTGYAVVDSDVSCVMTRFSVRSIWSLIRLDRSFRRVRREARSLRGLITTLFVVENRDTCYTISIWRNTDAILEFNAKVRSHIAAANWGFRELRFDSGKPRLWSAQFKLEAVSPHNLRWKEFDAEREAKTSSNSLEIESVG